jgi:hypothetical protein
MSRLLILSSGSVSSIIDYRDTNYFLGLEVDAVVRWESVMLLLFATGTATHIRKLSAANQADFLVIPVDLL